MARSLSCLGGGTFEGSLPCPLFVPHKGRLSNQLSYVPAVRRVRLSATLNTLPLWGILNALCAAVGLAGVSLGVGQGVWGGVLIYAMWLLDF